jgi:tetratricopeptide (TPR) repeat protein
MKTVRLIFIAAALAMVVSGCAATWQKMQGWVSAPAGDYRKKAGGLESRGELHKALLMWRVVAELDKSAPEATQAIGRIERKIARTARKHYRQGLKEYQSGDYRNALRDFLITLRLQPHHEKARYYLKVRLQNREQAEYRVEPGDSYSRIASKIYHDGSKAYMIAYFNDLDPRKPLMIGTPLLLPVLDPSQLQLPPNIKALLDEAQTAFGQKRYRRVITLAGKIKEEIPEHAEASRLADAAHFHEGKRLFKLRRYLAAIEQYKQIGDSYRGRDRAIAEARTHIKHLAVDEKLKQAQEHLRAKKWQSAINVTEEILANDPGNTQARILFSNAGYNLGKQLLDHGKTVQAADLLGRIDPSYEDTGQLLSLARARMRAKAETLYRDGVKHFINEELEAAIEDWKQTLALNPQHPKARQDMENAQRLLEKLRTLDSQDPDTP